MANYFSHFIKNLVIKNIKYGVFIARNIITYLATSTISLILTLFINK